MGFAEIKLMAPPVVFLPHNVPCGPSNTSTRSRSYTGWPVALTLLKYTSSKYTPTGLCIWSSKGQVDKKIRAELWGAKTFIDQHPDLTQLVATAYVRAQYWESQEQNRAAVIHEVTLGGTPEKAALQAYDDDTLAWKDYFTPIFDQALIDHYRRTADFAVQQHLIRTPIQAADLLQTKFVTAALQDLKLEHFWTQVPPAPRSAALAPRP